MEDVKCKRCGRILRNKESIKRGYGKTCYNIMQLNQEQNKPNEELIELKNKWNQLSLKFSILEKKFNQLIEDGLVSQNVESIKRIKPNNSKNMRDLPYLLKNLGKYQNNKTFTFLVKELKTIFHENFDYHEILNPINIREKPEEPPLIIENLELITI